MREMGLFRGKTGKGKWIKGSLLKIQDRYFIIPSETQLVRLCERLHIHWDDMLEVIPETVGEYTGKEVNDKKIFEGDKIKGYWKGRNDTKRIRGTIEFEEYMFGLVNEIDGEAYSLNRIIVEEIIGNKYED